MLVERQQEFMHMVKQLLDYLCAHDIKVVGGDLWRSTDLLPCPHCKIPISYQELLLTAGRTKVKVSQHNNKLAIDLTLQPGDDSTYRTVGEFWEGIGGRWGGRFGVTPDLYREKIGWDRFHFELPS